MSEPFALRSRHVVTPDGIAPATIVVRDGRFAEVNTGSAADASDPSAASASGAPVPIDLGELWVLPGLVDTHVHVNDPGRADWEGFPTAIRAAAAGGITTIVDMPLNSVPATTTVEALRLKRAAASAGAAAPVAGSEASASAPIAIEYWGGLVPGNLNELEPLAAAGVRGFKCFMVPSGVDEFGWVGEAELESAMPVIAKLGLPLLAHAELPGPIESAAAALAGRDPRAYATWLASRPRAAELEAIRLLIRLAERHRCHVHVVHLATGDALAELAAARARGVPVTVETCPHYLTFAAEEIGDGETGFKCAPPIRERAQREALWQGLRDRVIDLVASDHSPCPTELKLSSRGDFFGAWGGIASLELTLSAVWTGARARGFTLHDVVRWMAAAPARLAGLEDRTGALAPGLDADLVVFDPEADHEVAASELRQRHPLTAYAGRTLRGRVEVVWAKGRLAYERGTFLDRKTTSTRADAG